MKEVRIAGQTGLTIKSVTGTARSYVGIAEEGLTTAVTPTSSDASVENATRSLEQRVGTQPDMRVT